MARDMANGANGLIPNCGQNIESNVLENDQMVIGDGSNALYDWLKLMETGKYSNIFQTTFPRVFSSNNSKNA